jgi:hypothetical protein
MQKHELAPHFDAFGLVDFTQFHRHEMLLPTGTTEH